MTKFQYLNKFKLYYLIAFLAVFNIVIATFTKSCSNDDICSDCSIVEECEIINDTDNSKLVSNTDLIALNNGDASKVLNEFEDFDDSEEFKDTEGSDEFEKFSDTEILDEEAEKKAEFRKKLGNLYWVIGILFFTAIAGILVRYKPTRYLKVVLLLSSLLVLGFYQGGCPCMISSFQDVILAGIGQDVHWINFLWFLGLIPLTYIFGQVWCGWICHLGAFQEFLYKKNKFTFLKSQRSQKIMKIIRYLLVATLIIQVIATQSNIFIKIDPFKVAFNLTSYYAVGWYLLALIFLTSLFIYRPFCKAACPVGLILGWTSKIPGALIISKKDDCVSCKTCSDSCDMQAINRNKGFSTIDNQDCFMCGDCVDSCKSTTLSFYRKNKEHSGKEILHNGNDGIKINQINLTSN